jgi:hypothetical protein
MSVRKRVIDTLGYNLTPIIVVDKVVKDKLIIQLDATTYEDSRETLLI